MMTAAGPKVLEFNVRMGDPETQPLMHRMASDFVPALLAAAEGRPGFREARMARRARACAWCWRRAAIRATYETGGRFPASNAAEALGATVFHAGTRMGAHGLETAGGRVLGVTAGGGRSARRPSIARTRRRAEIRFEGMHYRRDIGRKGPRTLQ